MFACMPGDSYRKASYACLYMSLGVFCLIASDYNHRMEEKNGEGKSYYSKCLAVGFCLDS